MAVLQSPFDDTVCVYANCGLVTILVREWVFPFDGSIELKESFVKINLEDVGGVIAALQRIEEENQELESEQ